MSKDGSKFIDFSEVDPVVKKAAENIARGKLTFIDYRSTFAKLRAAMDKTFEMSHLSIGNDSHRPDMYRSALGRIQTEIAKKSIKSPEVEIRSLIELPGLENLESLDPKQIEEMEKASIAKALDQWFVSEAKVDAIEKSGREYWLGFGDQFSRPYTKKLKNGKVLPQYENIRPDLVIADPDGEAVDSGSTSTDYQFFYSVRILTREMVVTDYGEEILEYIKPDGKIIGYSELIDTKKMPNSGAVYYLEFSGQNKSGQFDCTLLGSGLLPVRRYSKETFKAKVGAEKLVKDLKLDHGDEYVYKDSSGEPYLNVVHKHCFRKEGSPYNYGIQQKVYHLQAIQEYTENGKIDNFRRGLEELIYATNIRANQLDNAYDEYAEKKRKDIRAILTIPPTYGQQPPTIGSLNYPQINPITSQQITDDIVRLARNAVGVDPNRVEIQKSEGLGIREMLVEERVETIQDIVEDSLIAIEKGVEKRINFCVIHKGFGLNNVFIQYEGIDESPEQGVRFKRKKSISITDACEKLKDWNYNVVVSVDNMVKKSNAILVERIFSMLERLDPNAYPDLYKKLILKLNEVLQLNISAEEMVQKAPAQAVGGASQFIANSGGGNQPVQNPGQLPGQPGAIPPNSPGEAFAGLGVGQ